MVATCPFGLGVGNLAEIFHPRIRVTGLQMSAGRAPETKVKERAGSAILQKLWILGAYSPHSRHQVLPGAPQAALSQVSYPLRVPEVGAKSEEAIVAYGEAAQARTARKKLVTMFFSQLRDNKLITAFL